MPASRLLVGLAAAIVPHRALGPVRVGDPGRVLVLLWSPSRRVSSSRFRRGRDRDSRRLPPPGTGLDPRAALLLALALCGRPRRARRAHAVLPIPGSVLRTDLPGDPRAVARDRALRPRARRSRRLGALAPDAPAPDRRALAAAAAAMACSSSSTERFRSPLAVDAGASRPRLRVAACGVDFPGAVVEWPLGIRHDFEYVLRAGRRTEKPLVNGYSGFFPPQLRRARGARSGSVRSPTPSGRGWRLSTPRSRASSTWTPARSADRSCSSTSASSGGASRAGSRRGGRLLPARRRDGRDPASRRARPPFVRRSRRGPRKQALERDQRRRRAHRAALRRRSTFPSRSGPGSGTAPGPWTTPGSPRSGSRRSGEPKARPLLHMRMPGLFDALPRLSRGEGRSRGFGFPIPDLLAGNAHAHAHAHRQRRRRTI